MGSWQEKVEQCKKIKSNLKVGQEISNHSGDKAIVDNTKDGGYTLVRVLRFNKKVFWNIDSLKEYVDH